MPESPYDYRWIVDNRTKRGIALDLRQPEGCSARLVERADVFLTNVSFDSRARPSVRLGRPHALPLRRRPAGPEGV